MGGVGWKWAGSSVGWKWDGDGWGASDSNTVLPEIGAPHDYDEVIFIVNNLFAFYLEKNSPRLHVLVDFKTLKSSVRTARELSIFCFVERERRTNAKFGRQKLYVRTSNEREVWRNEKIAFSRAIFFVVREWSVHFFLGGGMVMHCRKCHILVSRASCSSVFFP